MSTIDGFNYSFSSSDSTPIPGLAGVGPFPPSFDQGAVLPGHSSHANMGNEVYTPQPVVSTLFVDNVAKEFGLTVVQRGHLHTCAQLGSVNGGLSKADLSTRLFHMAVLFGFVNESKHDAQKNSIDNITQLLDDLRVRLDDTYTFTREQTRNIRAVAQDTIYEPTRTSFMRMHLDVLQKLRDDKTGTKLTAVFGNAAREKALASLVKRTCSSVRNSFRQDLRNSMCGDSTTPLAQLTYATAMKFKRGGAGVKLDVGYSVHNAILRRFAREHPTAIGVEELEVEEDDTAEEPASSPEPPSKKRRVSPSTNGGGRIAKGKDFWSMVDAFFTAKMTELGSKSLQSAGWKEYIQETLSMDEKYFPSPTDSSMDTETPPASSSVSPSLPGISQQTQGRVSLLSVV
ncbi:hypothetical protein R3P38DRAFT_2900373 [Favolaschia claudopus]|uniref:Uncharacterized protein n=1 Tax=Favolaschia claudopus TaxID=2862362 RepID=A0AAW0CKT4_9AGAR